MAAPQWCFVDHQAKGNVETRKLVRANAARKHWQQQRMRRMQSMSKNRSVQHDDQIYPGSLVLAETPEEHECDKAQHLRLHGLEGQKSGEHSGLCRAPSGRTWVQASQQVPMPIILEPVILGTPGLANQPRYGALLNHCKLCSCIFLFRSIRTSYLSLFAGCRLAGPIFS